MTGVAVVVPVRDGERYLGEALDSVLGQVPAPAEVVVVDDGSTDGSAAVARSFGERVSLVQTEARGPGAARNTGIARTTAPVLGFLDADDLWLPGALAVRLAALGAEVDVVRGRVEEFVSPDVDPAHAPRPATTASTPGHLLGGVLLRRALVERVGPLREDLRVGEFIDWYARAQEAGLVAVDVPEVVLRRRLHATNTGRQDPGSRVDLTRVVREALRRRREVAP
ncbi:glycosyl transferase family 2 [Motilibacter rhizosphaerae]|uniref:Glycosyl transferase family 2 n=1 Tax=Motilibacter rhizosphaerae TaxID=598652 RepID=A0A4Q7NW64_9ACTN|nr:glycosyltransferase family A protein [Motilibacter rhizosphaerae]RZS91445.1 glycosyl transferase family 2 [Motilibacter rhizosphaerae]